MDDIFSERLGFEFAFGGSFPAVCEHIVVLDPSLLGQPKKERRTMAVENDVDDSKEEEEDEEDVNVSCCFFLVPS